ncbi:uncharacterized protein [Prorops nasuta]|uniref:uncharacterized protein n=1 Tax=Prorops nasuta TaxID=863751 RepID=UPI0034CD94B4
MKGEAAIFLLLASLHLQLTKSFIAYDCGMPSINITTLDTLHIRDCNKPISDPQVTDTAIQLLQIKDFSSIHVKQCKIEILRTVLRCGMYSHVSAVNEGLIGYIEEVAKDECIKIHNTKSFSTRRATFDQIIINQTISRPITLAGSLASDGTCAGEYYSDYYGSWNSVVVFGQIKFTMTDYQASVNLEKNEIILRSGIRCGFTSESCMDSEDGNTYWEVKQTNCNSKSFSILYEGPANKTIDKEKKETVFSVASDSVSFALASRGSEKICGYPITKTEHPKLFIIDGSTEHHFFHDLEYDPKNLDIFVYLNSKLIFLERHMRHQIINLYNEVAVKHCELSNQLLRTELSTQAIRPADFAYSFMKKKGYMSYRAGETVHISKCLPVEVTVRETKECYQELPVSRGNISLFMTPVTRILVNTANKIQCNKIVAPMYYVNDQWIKLSPEIHRVIPPEVIASNLNINWTYEAPINLASGGIYSDKDIKQLKEVIMFPLEKPTVLNTIAREATGHYSQNHGLQLNTLLDKEALQSTIKETWNKIFNDFEKIGNLSAIVMGIWMVGKIIKFIIDTLIHGYALHAVYGWSLYLVGAVWDSITNLLLHLRRGIRVISYNNNSNIEAITQNNELHTSPTLTTLSISNEKNSNEGTSKEGSAKEGSSKEEYHNEGISKETFLKEGTKSQLYPSL